jgi:hypothetical protein
VRVKETLYSQTNTDTHTKPRSHSDRKIVLRRRKDGQGGEDRGEGEGEGEGEGGGGGEGEGREGGGGKGGGGGGGERNSSLAERKAAAPILAAQSLQSQPLRNRSRTVRRSRSSTATWQVRSQPVSYETPKFPFTSELLYNTHIFKVLSVPLANK